MKLIASFTIVALLSLSTFSQESADKFVYADFEKMENGRPISSNGGLVQIYTGKESTPVTFKGLANASPGRAGIDRLERRATKPSGDF